MFLLYATTVTVTVVTQLPYKSQLFGLYSKKNTKILDYIPKNSYFCSTNTNMMIQRALKEVIERQLYHGKAIVLVGARQVGKTTLLSLLANESNQPVLMLNCDETEARNLLENTNVAKLKMLIGTNKLVIIDEAQKVDNIGLTLKLIVDNFKDIQVIATGSSAFELRNRLNAPPYGTQIGIPSLSHIKCRNRADLRPARRKTDFGKPADIRQLSRHHPAP